MKPEQYYEELLLKLQLLYPEQAQEMVDFLRESALESQDEIRYLNEIGTVDQACTLFIAGMSETAQQEEVLLPEPPAQYGPLKHLKIELNNAEIIIRSGKRLQLKLHHGADTIEFKQTFDALTITPSFKNLFSCFKKAVFELILSEQEPLQSLKISLVNGKAAVMNVTAQEGKINVVNGSIQMEQSAFGQLMLDNVNGPIVLNGIQADHFKAGNVNGNMEMKNCFFKKGYYESINGRFELYASPVMKLKVRTELGHILAPDYAPECIRKDDWPSTRFKYVPVIAFGSMKVNIAHGTALIYNKAAAEDEGPLNEN